jgi:hypothetical protein
VTGSLGGRFPGRWLLHRPGRLFGWAAGLLAGVVLAASLLGMTEPIPGDEIDGARRALVDARIAATEVMEPGLMTAADAEWNLLLDALRAHGESVLTTRWIDSMRVRARSTQRLAREAEFAAVSHRAVLTRQHTERRLTAVATLEAVRDASRFYPAGIVSADSLSAAVILLARADGASSRGNLLVALRRLELLEATLARETAKISSLEDSLKTESEGWLAQLDRLHKSGRYPFLAVDKAARRLLVVRSRSDIDTFRVELGPAWLGDKRQAGDQRTPEGTYSVSRLLGAGKTRYHRALLLDYPTRADRARFNASRRSGNLGPDARIGGLIEIHGGGGRESDWTDGCVALADSDMERLFLMVPAGTRVLIAPTLP